MYDWEATAPCLQGLTPVFQLTRRFFNLPRLSAQTAGLPWMIAISGKLGNSATALKRLSPAHLSLKRTSTIGLNGLEIELLVDWLESPEFPRGLHTFLAPLPPPPPRRMPPSSAAGGSPNPPPAAGLRTTEPVPPPRPGQ
jgi:hypothetical protein